MHDPSIRVLLVEDDVRLASEVADYLERQGLAVRVVHRGEQALEAAKQADLVVLDWMLPDADGLSVCNALRAQGAVPILMLTAREGDASEVQALEGGADDYLAKPVRPRVLLARIQALLRRASAQRPAGLLELGRLRIDAHCREVRVAGEPVQLTDAEFNLLHLLGSRAGTVLSRDALSLAVTGRAHDGLDRTIDQYVSRLRRKLGDDARSPELIKTVRSEGYLLVPGEGR